MAVQWTKDQQRVIDTRKCNLLVSAAAGSGKTAVLVERILHMITEKEHPIDISRLLIVTFTNAAAAEMRERIGAAIEDLLEQNPEDAHLQRQSVMVHHADITTMHSFCMKLVRGHFSQLEIDPSFRVGDEGEIKLMKADVMRDMLEAHYEAGEEAFEEFVESYASGKADGKIDEFIEKIFNFAMSNPWPEEWFLRCQNELSLSSYEEMKKALWMQYLMEDVSIQLKELVEQTRQAVEVCGEEDGPGVYLPMLQSDLAKLEQLEGVPEYEDLNRILQEFCFDKLAAVRGKDVDPEKKELVTGIRNRVKKAIGKMQELYCFGDSGTILEEIEGSSGPIKTLLDLAEEFAALYQARKLEQNMVDFDDLEHFALKILLKEEDGGLKPTQAADQLSRQYEEILVDEYQDSNYVQEAILTSISRERFGRPNVFMVGDVKQSIYRFRLARPELFMEKYEIYKNGEGAYQKIELHQNFRSRASVLESINKVFYQIMSKNLGNIQYTEETALHPGAEFKDTEKKAGTLTELLLVDADSDMLKQLDEENADYTSREIEARLIAAKIQQMTDPEHGLWVWDKKEGCYRTARCGDMVILLRSISGWAEPFINVLMGEGITAYAESKTGYFDTVEVETMLSLLGVIDNPMQDICMAAVLRSPIGGLKDEELAQLAAVYKRQTESREERSLYGAVNYYLSRNTKDEVSRKLNICTGFLEEFSFQAKYLSIHELLYHIFQRTGYYDYVSAMPAGDIRRANLDMLVEKAMAFEQTSYHGLFHFIRYIEKLKKYNTDFGEAVLAGDQENTVRIMSIHKSKGLEFPIVFLAGMAKNFNKQDAYSRILIDPDLGVAADYMDLERRVKAPTLKKNVLKRRTELENLGEELRVLYVAMTRAKEKLIMTAADKSLEKRLEKWSGIGDGSGISLPFTALSSAATYLDWILMSLPGAESVIEVTRVPLSEVVGGEVERQAIKAGCREELEGLDRDVVYNESFRAALEATLSYNYPYQNDVGLHAKVSVSELKKTGQNVDEEESDFLPTIPSFMEGEQSVLGGVYRGSAYHRALELLSFGSIHTEAELHRELDRLVEGERLPKEQYDVITPSVIWRFLNSPLGKRMAEAEKKGLLYREKQFVIGIPASQMGQGDSEELVLIQGIIDCYFEEDGQLVLADYKTDRIGEGEEHILSDRYGVQLDYYEKALEQILGIPVKEKTIYSFALQKEIVL